MKLPAMARSRVRLGATKAAGGEVQPTALALVRDGGHAYSLLRPIRRRILEALNEPDSASGVARRLRLPRQVGNYHMGELARARFLLPAGRRRRRNFLDRCYVASARTYLLSPEILGGLGASSRVTEDRFSSAFLLGLAGQIQTELGRVCALAESAGKTVATFSLNSVFRFVSPEQRAAFAEDLERSVLGAVARHTSPATRAEGAQVEGRPFRLAVACYPIEEQAVAPPAAAHGIEEPPR
jgi:hypothetical protein